MRDMVENNARSVAEAGAQYAVERWLGYAPPDVQARWHACFFDALFAGALHAVELHERALAARRERRRRHIYLWCLKCRKTLRVSLGWAGKQVVCPVCGHRQQAPVRGAGAN